MPPTSSPTHSAHCAIAIDGPAASGKSTLAHNLARRLGFVMVNSGAIYRAFTWKVIEAGIDPHDEAAVTDLLNRTEIVCGDDGAVSFVTIDEIDPVDYLRSEAVNANVSAVSAIPAVREKLIDLQRHYLDRTNIVIEGRDIGTVVFPETPYKIYVDADERVRTARRENAGEIDSVARRDAADSGRLTSPLKIAEGAAILDTSHHTIESGLNAALEILKQQGLSVPNL